MRRLPTLFALCGLLPHPQGDFLCAFWVLPTADSILVSKVFCQIELLGESAELPEKTCEISVFSALLIIRNSNKFI